MNYDPECSRLCAKGCGFFGSSATKNMCSKCYNHYLKEAVAKSAMAMAMAPHSNPFPWVNPSYSSTTNDDNNNSTLKKKKKKKMNRCEWCEKKIGLTGFGCRCGGMFCGAHRYPEEHSCTFDFKTAGRAALAKENIVCKSDKLEKRV